MSYVIDGVLGLDFFRYSSNILHTPERQQRNIIAVFFNISTGNHTLFYTLSSLHNFP